MNSLLWHQLSVPWFSDAETSDLMGTTAEGICTKNLQDLKDPNYLIW